MPTATLVPTSLTDSQSNVAAGAYTDIDETIASADGTTLDSVTNQWTPSAGTGSSFTFGMSDLPAEAVSINTVQFRVRGRVTSDGGGVDDTVDYRCDVQGTNAPSTVAQFTDTDADAGFNNRGAASPVTSSASVADINGWSVRVYQNAWSLEGELYPGSDNLNLEIDCIEIIVDYNVDAPDPPSDPPTGGGYTVIPTTDTSIYGLCIATVRDFVMLGGMDTDRYTVRWCDIGDPTSWSTPATDAARAAQAGQQTFPTRYGFVTAIAGDEFSALIFQESAIHKATYVGGDIVFSFETIDENRGCVRQGRMVKVDDTVYFQSNHGYHAVSGGRVSNIGYGIVDDTFN